MGRVTTKTKRSVDVLAIAGIFFNGIIFKRTGNSDERGGSSGFGFGIYRTGCELIC